MSPGDGTRVRQLQPQQISRRMNASFTRVPRLGLQEGLDAGLRPAQNQRMTVVRAFLGIDRFEIHDMADHTVFI